MTVGKKVVKPKREKFELDRLIAENYPDVEDTTCVEIRIPNDLAYLYALQGLYAQMTNAWAWSGTPADRSRRAAIVEKAYVETDWGECMNCEELTECLQPLFDAIGERFNTLDAAVAALQAASNAIQAVQEINASTPLELPQESVASAVCGGAYALVREMDKTNRLLYQEAEDSFVDNAAEWISMILDIFPAFAAQGVNAGAEIANALASNNVASYEAAYLTFEDIAVGSLKCKIEANDGYLSYDVWGDWLDGLPALFSPSNFAADLYAKYSPLRQTFLNQIAELINQENSLQEYFDDLWNVYYTGTTTPLTCPAFFCPTQYCDDMALGLGAMTFEASSSNPYASWNACAVSHDGEVGGTWTSGQGEDGNGAIVGELVCASDPTFGLAIRQATAGADLGDVYKITNVNYRFLANAGGSNAATVSFFDDTGAFISEVGALQANSPDWQTFDQAVDVSGVRYVVFNHTTSVSFDPRIGQICVNYQQNPA